MHNPDFVKVLKERFPADEVQKIVEFLERGFSPNGELVVVSIFGFAKDADKPFADVLAVCEREWEGNWHYQHPDLRGDPDAPGGAGRNNRNSLDMIYNDLKIPNPVVEGGKIPMGPLIVKTCNSTYKFGQADENGERSVTKDNDNGKLACTRCKITFLRKGQEMEFVPLDSTSGSNAPWHTSGIMSITSG